MAVRHVGNCRSDRGDRPRPSKLRRLADPASLIDAPDDLAVGKHVIVLVLPLAGGRENLARLRMRRTVIAATHKQATEAELDEASRLFTAWKADKDKA